MVAVESFGSSFSRGNELNVSFKYLVLKEIQDHSFRMKMEMEVQLWRRKMKHWRGKILKF
jgi:predicted transcriptional regulator